MAKAGGPRGARAKRRSQQRHPAAQRPDDWPSGEVLAEALAIDELAGTLLAELKPETVRMILQRMDVQLRKALFEPRNIPITKVSLRAAGQVLELLRAEDKPAEGQLLGTMLSPAAELFNEANVGPTQRTGLRLKIVELALPLIISDEPIFRGLRTWHRWCDDSFEDITLAAVIGQHCSHAGLAAAYLAYSHPDIARRYENLRAEYPKLPEVAEGRLTSSNPLTRYLAARPDRKLPNTAIEMRMLLREDARVRQTEIQQARRERAEAATAREQQLRRREDALTRQIAPPPESVTASTRADPLATPSDPGLSALPDMSEWAAAVTDSRTLTQRLINGEPPSISRLRSIIDLNLRLSNMATVVSRVLGEPVGPGRGDIDRALTVILADRALSEKLGPVPGTVAEVTEALRRLPPLPDEDRPPADRSGATPDGTGTGPATPAGPQFAAATAAARPPSETGSAATEPAHELDLSDLDSILHGEAGARLVALAGNRPAVTGDREATAQARPGAEPEPAAEPPDDDPDGTGQPTPPPDPQADELERLLVTAARWARHPGGTLAAEYAAALSQLDFDAQLGGDPRRRLRVAATALPMALLDPAAGAAELLDIEVPELADWPNVVSLRRVIAGFTRNGGSLYAPDMQLHALLSSRLTRIRYRARQIRETAATRTLKYDKATKVYRAWFSPGGRLRPLLDCLEKTEFSKLQVLVDDAEKIGAARAVNETLSDLFDKGKPRIVAGARQSLVDSYQEVVNLGSGILTVHRAILDRASARHDAHRRFQRVSDFGEQVERLREGIATELDGPAPPPPTVRIMVNRALEFQHHILPLTGPEPAITWLLERHPVALDGPA